MYYIYWVKCSEFPALLLVVGTRCCKILIWKTARMASSTLSLPRNHCLQLGQPGVYLAEAQANQITRIRNLSLDTA